jgi:hypothetical protein
MQLLVTLPLTLSSASAHLMEQVRGCYSYAAAGHLASHTELSLNSPDGTGEEDS